MFAKVQRYGLRSKCVLLKVKYINVDHLYHMCSLSLIIGIIWILILSFSIHDIWSHILWHCDRSFICTCITNIMFSHWPMVLDILSFRSHPLESLLTPNKSSSCCSPHFLLDHLCWSLGQNFPQRHFLCTRNEKHVLKNFYFNICSLYSFCNISVQQKNLPWEPKLK